MDSVWTRDAETMHAGQNLPIIVEMQCPKVKYSTIVFVPPSADSRYHYTVTGRPQVHDSWKKTTVWNRSILITQDRADGFFIFPFKMKGSGWGINVWKILSSQRKGDIGQQLHMLQWLRRGYKLGTWRDKINQVVEQDVETQNLGIASKNFLRNGQLSTT